MDAPMLAEKLPGTHDIDAVDPVAHQEPDGQSVHSVAAVREKLLENVPDGQEIGVDVAAGQ